jgi:hypothetical protein
MSKEQKFNFAKLYVQLFLLVNILMLLVGMFFATLFINSGPDQSYGGTFLLIIGTIVAAIQPVFGILVSILYLNRVSWAKIAMTAVLSLIFGFWTLFTADMWFFETGEIEFLIIWASSAALIVPGIILVYRQEFVPRPKTTSEDDAGI